MQSSFVSVLIGLSEKRNGEDDRQTTPLGENLKSGKIALAIDWLCGYHLLIELRAYDNSPTSYTYGWDSIKGCVEVPGSVKIRYRAPIVPTGKSNVLFLRRYLSFTLKRTGCAGWKPRALNPRPTVVNYFRRAIRRYPSGLGVKIGANLSMVR